jgi:hypothetical protein
MSGFATGFDVVPESTCSAPGFTALPARKAL